MKAGRRLPASVYSAVRRHIKEFGCHVRDRLTESFTYHVEFELMDRSISHWVGRCDACRRVVRVRMERQT